MTYNTYYPITIFLGFLFLLLPTNYLYAQNVITINENIVDSSHSEPEPPSQEVARSKLMVYSAKSLFKDIKSNKNQASLSYLRIKLFDDKEVILVPSSITLNGEYFEWIGNIKGDKLGHAILHIRDNSLYGVIRYGHEQYQIKYQGNDSDTAEFHVIHQIDESKFTEQPNDVFLVEKGQLIGLNVTPKTLKVDDTVIDILVVYTPSASQSARRYGGDKPTN